MSSPSMGEAFGYHDRALVSSPGLGPRGESLQGPEDVAVRPMRREQLSNTFLTPDILRLTELSQGALHL